MKKKINEKKVNYKLFITIIYFIILTILLVLAFNLYKDNKNIKLFSKVDNTEEYCYIKISKMSDKFAYLENENIGLHFVIENEETGQWHTYIVAIDENDIDKYKDIIKYTKGETNLIPKEKKVYGYAVNVDENIKRMAINNINSFLPSTNEVEITNDNYENYLTDSYLDTTKNNEIDINSTFIFIVIITIIISFIYLLIMIDRSNIIIKTIRRLK